MSCVDTKNHLLSAINDAGDSHTLCIVCETIIVPVLTHTEGFWIELTYCYKAAEIADRCIAQLDHYIHTCQHHKTHQKLANMRLTMMKLGDRYRYLQAHRGDTNPVVAHCHAG